MNNSNEISISFTDIRKLIKSNFDSFYKSCNEWLNITETTFKCGIITYNCDSLIETRCKLTQNLGRFDNYLACYKTGYNLDENVETFKIEARGYNLLGNEYIQIDIFNSIRNKDTLERGDLLISHKIIEKSYI